MKVTRDHGMNRTWSMHRIGDVRMYLLLLLLLLLLFDDKTFTLTTGPRLHDGSWLSKKLLS